MDITPNCDCMDYSEYPLTPDVGILFSYDPVAIDKASVDLVNKESIYFYEGKDDTKKGRNIADVGGLTISEHSGEDKFLNFRSHINYQHLIDFCAKQGMGEKEYRLIKIN